MVKLISNTIIILILAAVSDINTLQVILLY